MWELSIPRQQPIVFAVGGLRYLTYRPPPQNSVRKRINNTRRTGGNSPAKHPRVFHCRISSSEHTPRLWTGHWRPPTYPKSRLISLRYDWLPLEPASNGLKIPAWPNQNLKRFGCWGLDKRSSLDSVQQAMFFATLTGKQAGVVIFDTDGVEGRYEFQIRTVAELAGVEYIAYDWEEGLPNEPEIPTQGEIVMPDIDILDFFWGF